MRFDLTTRRAKRPPMLSTGHRTDLMVLRLTGSVLETCGVGTLIRTVDNPGFRWGNFLLLDDSASADGLWDWRAVLQTYRDAFPGEPMVRLGLASGVARMCLPHPWSQLNLEGDVALACSIAPKAPVPTNVRIRALAGDSDWAAALGLQRANSVADGGADGEEGVDFLKRQLLAQRRSVERGSGAWWGAFIDGMMAGGLGIFSDGSGEARYQAVDVLPPWRRRGVASALVAVAGRWALEELGASQLVIVAESASPALRLYRGLGFTAVDRQWRLSGPMATLASSVRTQDC